MCRNILANAKTISANNYLRILTQNERMRDIKYLVILAMWINNKLAFIFGFYKNFRKPNKVIKLYI